MRKAFIGLLILILCAFVQFAYSATSVSGRPCPGGGATDYCTSQSWDTFAAFRLDFDHTTDTKTACLASSTQVGVLTGTAALSTPSPATTGIGSGGNALVPSASGDYIHFDNTSSIFQSQYGEIMFKLNLAGNNTTDITVFSIVQVAAQDRLEVYIGSNGMLTVRWEDNNKGAVLLVVSSDFDNYYGDWVQLHIKWDTTRCSDGICDGVGEDEFAIRWRIDANNDGDFDDGGVETWSAWYAETSALDFAAWSAEPTTDKIQFGFVAGTFDVGIPVWVDDLEISNAQPSW